MVNIRKRESESLTCKIFVKSWNLLDQESISLSEKFNSSISYSSMKCLMEELLLSDISAHNHPAVRILRV